MKNIDIENWKRKQQFEMFKEFELPHFNLCAEVDITKLLQVCKTRGISSFTAIVYLVAKASNDIDAFRMRIRGDNVVLHEKAHPSFTVLGDDDVFSYCTSEYFSEAAKFVQGTQAAIEEAKSNASLENPFGEDEYLYMSCLPWVKFTSVSHAMRLNPSDSIPRYSWGKYDKQGAKMVMPLSVQVHHAVVDGVHVGEFYQRVEASLDAVDQIFDF